jgi:hypothetical protein
VELFLQRGRGRGRVLLRHTKGFGGWHGRKWSGERQETGVSKLRNNDSRNRALDLACVAEGEDYIRTHLKEVGPGAVRRVPRWGWQTLALFLRAERLGREVPDFRHNWPSASAPSGSRRVRINRFPAPDQEPSAPLA